jgi:hypothetical protein
MVGLSGLEPPTSRLSGVRSNQLSYRPTSRGRGGVVHGVLREHSLPRPEATAWVTPCLDRREATDRRSKRGSGARMREE